MKIIIAAVAMSVALTACATAPKDFYANPGKSKDTALCRAVMETSDPQFQRDAATELVRRGLTGEDCQNKVNTENGVVAALAIVGGAAVIGAASAGGGFGGAPAYTNYNTDVDCQGGMGNGPRFVSGPFRLNGPDVYGLDADRDGIACEPYGDYGS